MILTMTSLLRITALSTIESPAAVPSLTGIITTDRDTVKAFTTQYQEVRALEDHRLN